MPKTWWEDWHGATKIPAGYVSGAVGGGGSTAMSTGVTLALSTKAGTGHGHAMSDVSALNSTLNALASQISTKAAGAHTHLTADVTGLDSTLAAISLAVSTKAAGTHTHAQSDVTGLVAALSSKADVSHTHPLAGVIPSTWVMASTHVLTGSTTMQSVTGLSFSVSSGSCYRYEFVVGWQTISSATGLALGINGPANPVLATYERSLSTGQGPLVTGYDNRLGVQQIAVPQSSAANLDNYAYVGGILRTGPTAGTLQLQYASEVAGSTVSIRGGSLGFLWGPF